VKPFVEIKPTRGFKRPDWRELWRARETLYILTWRDIKVRYKQTAIGATWAILQPFLTMVVLSVFLGSLANVPSQGFPYPLFIYSALIPWTFFAYALNHGGNSLVANEDLVTKVYLPRLVIPGSSVLAGTVDLAFATVVIVPLMVFYGQAPGPELALLPIAFVFVFVVSLGTVLWLAAINVRYRDVRYTIVFMTQLLFYLSPIAYPSSLVPDSLQAIYGLNPVSAPILAASALTSLTLVVTGWLYFNNVERTMADVV
jgi:lipopolysaccharide transport system permease protein